MCSMSPCKNWRDVFVTTDVNGDRMGQVWTELDDQWKIYWNCVSSGICQDQI